MTKQCSRCGEVKPITGFSPVRQNGYLIGTQSHCKACRAEAQARYRQRYPDQKIAYDEQWRASNREHKRAYDRAWMAAHPELHKQYSDDYIKRKRENGGAFTKEQFRQLCEGYGDKCLRCGSDGPLGPDHIIPVSKGGTSNIDNIQPLCASCNSKKHAKVIDFRPQSKAMQNV